VVRLVLVQSVWLALTGIGIGLVGALALTRTLQAVLFEVSPTDPVVLGAVTAVLLGMAVVASLLPARRAASVDPAETMRAS
jgi:ABC-type antimicrobial peptide transport system permease subunit